MNSLNKKGQTEDILADLIPAIIIIIIAVYLLGSFSSQHEENVSNKLKEVKSQLESRMDVRTYLRTAVPSDYKGECANPRLTTADIISKIDPQKAEQNKDPCYSLLRKLTNEFNQEYFMPDDKYMAVDLEFPYVHLGLYPKGVIFPGKTKNIPLPIKNGEHVNVKYSILHGFEGEQDK